MSRAPVRVLGALHESNDENIRYEEKRCGSSKVISTIIIVDLNELIDLVTEPCIEVVSGIFSC